MNTWLRGIGTAVPERTITQDAAIKLCGELCHDERQRRMLRTIYRASGIKSRGAVALNGSPDLFALAPELDSRGPGTAERMRRFREEAAPLALAAAAQALERSGIGVGEISDLVSVCCTGFGAPGFELDLIRKLELSPEIGRTHIGFMGCHGATNGLRAADALARRSQRSVLLVAVELCSLHYQFEPSRDALLANALFADGAAATVISAARPEGVEGVEGVEAVALAASGSCIIPDSQDLMAWHIGDHGFEMTLSADLPDLLRKHARPWVARWLKGLGLRIEEIGSWAVHPGGPRIVDAVAESIGLSSGQTAASREILTAHGNMSSPTVLFVVEQLRNNPGWLPCVLLAFGPGITVEAALLLPAP